VQALVQSRSLDKLSELVARFAARMRAVLPLPSWKMILTQLDCQAGSVLDVGCGRGGPIRLLRRRRDLYAVGMDIFWPYLVESRSNALYDAVVCCDVRYLPVRPGAFDIVLCSEVVEHLTRTEAECLIDRLEAIARLQVIITTPVGNCEQKPYDGNPHQVHWSTWTPTDFRNSGYSVYGSGLRGLAGMIARETSPLPEVLRLVANGIWMVASVFSYHFPWIGGEMVCIKSIGST